MKVFDSENVSSNNAELQKGTFEYTFPSAAFSVEGTYKRAYFSFQKMGKEILRETLKSLLKEMLTLMPEKLKQLLLNTINL